jgi:hypothetical protein
VLDTVTIPPGKITGLVVLTDELLKLAAAGSEEFLREEMKNGLVAFLDSQFVDPTVAAIPDVSPASITNGLTPVASSGSTAAAAVADIKALLVEYVANGGKIETCVLLLSSQNAVALNLTGNVAFEKLTREGGTLAGLPAVASDSLADQIVALDSRRVFLADDGTINISAARHASLEMLDNPTNNASTATGTSLLSLWATNSAALRVERYLNWSASDGAVAVLDGANYLAAGSPS